MEKNLSSGGQTARVCEACGQSFMCGALTGSCWCMSITLDALSREALRKTYNDCLCAACLSASNLDRVHFEPGPD